MVVVPRSYHHQCEVLFLRRQHCVTSIVECRKKAISRAQGIPSLISLLTGQSAEGSMHAAQALLHLAKLPDLKVCAAVPDSVPCLATPPASILHSTSSSVYTYIYDPYARQ